MTREEILEMLVANTEELVHEIGIYLHAKLEDDEELSGPEIPVFVLWLWNIEVQNGGLCQFFVNDGEYAALVPASLQTIGADEYAALLCDFVEKHGIDLNELSQFKIDFDSDEKDFSEYTDIYEQYPFDDFDEAFFNLYGSDPLEGRLADYIRKNIDTFITA